jgi:hypothetical protein
MRMTAPIAAAALLALQPALTQPAAPDPRTTIPEKIAPQSGGDDLSEKLDRSGGIIPPPADPGPGIEVAPPEPAPDMPVIRPPGSPGGDPDVQPK